MDITMHTIAHIRTDGLLPALRQAEVIAMCDIDNPLCGESGAAAVFAPQKGADAATVRMLDEGLAHLAAVIEKDLGRSLLTLPGGGAAGGGKRAAERSCRPVFGRLRRSSAGARADPGREL